MRLAKNMKIIKWKKMISTSSKSLFGILFFICLSTKAQEVYPLHPSVGDTLEAIEKLDYSLFPKIDNKDFKHGLIKYEEEAFVFYAFYEEDEKKLELSQAELIEAQQNIEKVNKYYRLKAAEANKDEQDFKKDNRPSGKTPVYFNEAMNDQIKKEARMHIRLQEDAQRMRDHRNGISPNRMILDFSK